MKMADSDLFENQYIQEMNADDKEVVKKALNSYTSIVKNIYLDSALKGKENEAIDCDCKITIDQLKYGKPGCVDGCINRLLFIECEPDCQMRSYCRNQKFKNREYAPISVFNAGVKGVGVKAVANIPPETFIIEYVGEIFNLLDTIKRKKRHIANGIHHVYFMSLDGNSAIDATEKGNIARFLNHSCDPNVEVQKWTVNGELKIGFFSLRPINKGEELTIDYHFDECSKVSQKCYCGSVKCRGWLGRDPTKDTNHPIEEDENVEDSSYYYEPIKAVKYERKFKGKKSEKSEGGAEVSHLIDKLFKSGIKNKSQVIELARLIVRVQEVDSRILILKIIKNADFQCRRLFLDYNGLFLLQKWLKNINFNSPSCYSLAIELLKVFDSLPISTVTILRKSKLLDEVENLKEITKNANHLSIIEEIEEKAKELIEKWNNLKEDFKIPKIVKSDEKILNEIRNDDEDIWEEDNTTKRFATYIPTPRRDNFKHFRHKNSCGNCRPIISQTCNAIIKKEASNAMREYKNRMYEEHIKNCNIFGLPPKTNPLHIPKMVNRSTGEFFNLFGTKINQPPNPEALYKPILKYPTNTDAYEPNSLPQNLPKGWKFAIDGGSGKCYYYHAKTHVSQWNPPEVDDGDKTSSSSSTETEDSEEVDLKWKLSILKDKMKRKKKELKKTEKKMKKEEKKLLKNVLKEEKTIRKNVKKLQKKIEKHKNKKKFSEINGIPNNC